jgi:hypothetical protein
MKARPQVPDLSALNCKSLGPKAGARRQVGLVTLISPAEPTMLIVPSGELLHLEARVATADYDLVARSVGLRTSACTHSINEPCRS